MSLLPECVPYIETYNLVVRHFLLLFANHWIHWKWGIVCALFGRVVVLQVVVTYWVEGWWTYSGSLSVIATISSIILMGVILLILRPNNHGFSPLQSSIGVFTSCCSILSNFVLVWTLIWLIWLILIILVYSHRKQKTCYFLYVYCWNTFITECVCCEPAYNTSLPHVTISKYNNFMKLWLPILQQTFKDYILVQNIGGGGRSYCLLV